MPEHILVIGSGRDLPTRLRRSRAGTRTTVVCRLDYLSKLRETTEHTRIIGVRPEAPAEEWTELAEAVHARDPFTRIVAFGERDQDKCAAVGRALGLAAHSPATVALVHDKHAMRVRLREAGVDSTASAVVSDVDELRAFLAAHGTPCIVKPAEGSFSKGIALVREIDEAAAAFGRASGELGDLHGTEVLVEQFHEGPQFSVEAFSEAGEHQIVAITRKYSDPRNFVELGHVSPAPLEPAQEKQVHDYVERILDALGIASGATHTEVVLSDAGPRVIETHVRMGGDEIPALAHDVTGVDLAECLIRHTLGEQVLPGIRATLAAPRTPRSSAIWFAALPAPGVLAEITGLAAAREVPGVTEVESLVGPGAAIETLESSASRVAHARAVAPTAEAALAAAREAIGRLTFHVGVRAADQGAL
ncbi:ATP-grasp domain-containing protein [Streptomyces sp. SID1034]|uniref:ATP-grasp domain-containing protein n=1 Tax=Streptomyces sp. SID1034 TaxID=2690248 RepID=UPI00136B23A1|nr:ATP-grasp domain-containing protein [Streptomyces sp. SID1034]MYV96014.1 ATP-grasp domain-containing protein [Streptomyces sp. SID1034]